MSYLGSPPASQFFAPGTDTFSGTGSQVAFTLSRNVATVNDILVIVNNVEQQPSHYSVSTSTLTFSTAPSSGTNNIYVRYLSTNLTAIVPQQGSVTPASLSTPNALYWDTSGNVGVGTTTPVFFSTYKYLQVQGSAAGTGGVFYTNTSDGSVAGQLYSAAGLVAIGSSTSTPLVFNTNNIERMRLDVSGNLTVAGIQLGLSGGTIKQYTGGATSLATTFTTDVVIQSQGGGLLMAQMYHYGNIGYGASRVSVVSVGPGGLAENNIQNATTGFGGSWSFARLNDTTVRVTKTGGSYAAGSGLWSITLLGN